MYFASGGNFSIYSNLSGTVATLNSTRLFRDTSAWYHFVVQNNNGTVTLYVNNQTVSLSSSTLGTNKINIDSTAHYIGRQVADTTQNFDGYMSHVSFVDGSVVAPTTFGETDSTSGIWKFKSPSGVTWGTNGFHLKFENSAALGTDSSGNTNTFAVNGNLKQALDTPSNVYATLNPLNLQASSPPTIIKGNTGISAIGDNDNVSTTLGGEFKWYYEAKCVQSPDGSNGYGLGVGACHVDTFGHSGWSAGNRSNFVYSEAKWYSNSLVNAGRFVQGNGNQVIGSLTQATAGDIIGCACDAANGKVYIHINGTYLNSGDPVNGTGFIGGTTGKSGMWFPFFSPDGTDYGTLDINFGNGYFGTTAISSAGSNGNGSLFEYDVPSGYYALNTKNLNTYG